VVGAAGVAHGDGAERLDLLGDEPAVPGVAGGVDLRLPALAATWRRLLDAAEDGQCSRKCSATFAMVGAMRGTSGNPPAA
jgi:hypothetical protein